MLKKKPGFVKKLIYHLRFMEGVLTPTPSMDTLWIIKINVLTLFRLTLEIRIMDCNIYNIHIITIKKFKTKINKDRNYTHNNLKLNVNTNRTKKKIKNFRQ
jgi:hypothetical protein